MHFAVRSALVGAVLLVSSVGRAQQPAPPVETSSEIVVTGQKHRDEQVRDFVKALTPARSGSIARFIEEVCPVTVGLAPEQNEKVSARVRRIAVAIGLQAAKPGCAPNAFVIVTPNKQAFIDKLAQERPESFGPLTHRQIRKLSKSPGPAAAWRLSGPVDESGIPLKFDEALGYVNETTQAASRLSGPARRGFDAAALVVETASVGDLTATQVADYAAMRLFAELDTANLPSPAPTTILSVLEAPRGTEVPITLTKWDLGLLRGLYTSSPNVHAASQRSAMAREVRKELERPDR